MKTSLGALAGRWSRSASIAFYDAVALSSVDVVYIGTAIHAPVAGLQKRDCLAVARELASGGKEVVLSVRAGGDRNPDGFHAWIEDCELPVEIVDAGTMRLLSGKVPLVIGTGVPCRNGEELKRLVGQGARRWIVPAVCKGEVMQALAYVGDTACEIELPVLTPRMFSRWRCPVKACGYEGRARHAMPGCDLDVEARNIVPDWAADLEALQLAGVAILRVTPKESGDIRRCQMLGDLVRGELDARDVYPAFAASLAHVRAPRSTVLHPWRRFSPRNGATVR